MKPLRIAFLLLIIASITSCRTKEKPAPKFTLRRTREAEQINIPINKGFSEYISGYTSGIVSVNSVIEIKFTPEFAARTRKENPSGLFMFDPAIRGKAEWTDNVTLTYKPAKILDPGTLYNGKLYLDQFADVKEDLKVFPIRIRTIKKDFIVTTGALEASEDGSKYSLHGELIASDYIPSSEVESYLQAKLGRNKKDIEWDHLNTLVHKFTIINIDRGDKARSLELIWDGTQAKVRQKGTATVNIPALGDFSVIGLILNKDDNQSIDVVFSDPVDASQEMTGLIRLSPEKETTVSINANIVSLFLQSRPEGASELNVEQSVKNKQGITLSAPFERKIDFSPVPPAIELAGEGVILPASQNLVFPFKASNLKAVDIKIIEIYENNLPSFLQENEMNTGNSVKRFGRPVYSGKIDLVTAPGKNSGGWNLYTVDLAEYIDVRPGILYKVELRMRPSYSLYPCTDREEAKKYDEMLEKLEESSREFWDDPENYYAESDDYLYYSDGFNWRDRDNPCKAAYFNPERKITRNILASNFGIIAKSGSDNNLHVMVNDLLTAMPLNEVQIDVYDFQLQKIGSGQTDQNGSARIVCERKPFLLIAGKDRDRNYLKLNDGASLSLSSFDVSGTKPENGIKAFIYGERDVWRPGDSIYLPVFIRDLNKTLPADHPVQFELLNPMEQKVDNQVQVISNKNLLVFRTVTASDAVTGDYKALFRIGGAVFSKRVRVETIKPNRLKIDLNFPSKILDASGTGTNGSLKVKWLNGSAAGNLKTSVEYLLKPVKTEFDKYSQFNFDDPAIQFYSETTKMFDGTIDENGNATVAFNPVKGISAPGMLNAVFTAKVMEKGGDESIIQTVYKYAPYPVFAGINFPGLKGRDRMLFTDADNEVRLATVDKDGNPVSSEVEITVYKISYRWWWESDQEDLASFISNNIYKPVISKQIRTTNGEGSFSFRIGRNEWGRYLVRASLPGGHSTGKVLLIDWPWEYGMKGKTEGATLLAISTDKDKYNTGDDVKLSFPAPENSRAIITLENATSVLEEIRTNTTKGNTVVSFKARPEMAPNIYAYVTVIQPHAQTLNDMPMRLYGVVPVMVEDPDTRLNPEISMADEVRSQKNFEISVSEAKKKPMTYTLAVVDEGLLDITGFKTPDPWNYFYAREALGVRTWDLYDLVLGAFGGTLERLLSVGGDEMAIDRSANKAQRFIPVVKFLGPFKLGQGKTAKHTITLPQYTGSVRTMVIAGNERAFGFAEKSVAVKDPLMILVTAPRVISPGEKVTLPVTLFVQKERIKSIDLVAEGNDFVRFDEKSKSLSVSGTGEKNAEFSFTAAERTGTASIKITALGGGESASYELSLNVRSPNPPETRAELKLLKPGEKWETSFEPFGMPGTDEASLEASTLPSVNLEKRMEYLLDYPHGCTEQIISAAFPQLWINKLSENNSRTGETASVNIKEAINKIISRQMVNGGIALWPGSPQADNWVTSYAGHFMTEAGRAGYSIPAEFMQKWTGYQTGIARTWKFDPRFKQSSNDQAYRLFSLALSGNPDKGAMNRLRESPDIPALAKWLLSAAYALTGRTEVAGDLLDMRNLKPEDEYSRYYYGSRLRDKAIILYTLSILKKEEEALSLLKEVCDDLNTESWYSTQSLSWGLLSYMKFAEMIPVNKAGQAKFSITFNNTTTDLTVDPGRLLLTDLKARSGTNNLTAVNNSDKPLYLNLLRKGVPLVSDQTGVDKGLSMKIDYLNTSLNPVGQKNLEQGTDFLMVAKVSNNTFTKVDNIALTEMVPSGWEIRNTRMFEANYGIKEGTFDYRDFRDDRVNTYFSLDAGETRTFVLVLNAAYKGEFYQPSVWCEAMYTENCYSRVPGSRVSVTGGKVE
ncbi:MAG: MG2 domain-containing protein [Bacteroidota bacterium]|nr:MG2 domain-containing protein [Bacteroidota bacterium]